MTALWSLATFLSAAFVLADGGDDELQTRPKITEYPPGSLNARLLGSMNGYIAKVGNWSEGSAIQQDSIPRACYDAVRKEGLDPKDVEVFTALYEDCGMEWEYCRHKDAAMSLNKMGDMNGKLPIKTRLLIPHILTLPGDERLYRENDLLVMGGNPSFVTILHQAGRAIDESCPFPGKASRCSDTESWLNAFGRDTYVVDDIARASQADNFAQIAIHSMFNLNFPTGLSSLNTDTNGMTNEILYDDEVKVQSMYCGEYLVANPDARCGSYAQKRDYVSKATGEKVDDPFKLGSA